eukprot:CAMPEP_0117753358 /NCGR_PEP_ID=MMETSP0947-20121206/12173_1 /TAXON_ID=44440 /ORGANISM="Chattonella subsalsa, Strain CCMP2191" /LENGTH=538 /DNA_ID=CAMNT_0005572215 /DNA_START=100 /DNA_END=1713 /DNA_ORIENTATION=-
MEPVAYLLPKELLLEKSSFPTFQEMSGKDTLLPIADWNQRKIPNYAYVAHNWNYRNEIDNERNLKMEVLQQILRKVKAIKYIWIDVTCMDLRNEQSCRSSLMQLDKLIEKSSRVFVLPHVSPRVPVLPGQKNPQYDVQNYTQWAWCMYELCNYLKRPSKIRMIQIRRIDGAEFNAEMVSLPSSDPSDQVEYLLSAFTEIETIVKSQDRQDFIAKYKVHDGHDHEMIWDCFVEKEETIFSGRRHETDFYSYKLAEDKEDLSRWSPTPNSSGKGTRLSPDITATGEALDLSPIRASLEDTMAKAKANPEDFQVGEPVRANFLGMGKDRSGCITKANSDGTFDIAYLNGAKEVHVSPHHILADEYVPPAVTRIGILKLEEQLVDKRASHFPQFLNVKKLKIGKKEKLISVSVHCSWKCHGINGEKGALTLKCFDRNGELKGSKDLVEFHEKSQKVTTKSYDFKDSDFREHILNTQSPGDTLSVWYTVGSGNEHYLQINRFRLEARYCQLQEHDLKNNDQKESASPLQQNGCQSCIVTLFSW